MKKIISVGICTAMLFSSFPASATETVEGEPAEAVQVEAEDTQVIEENQQEEFKEPEEDKTEISLQSEGATKAGKFVYAATTDEKVLVEPAWVDYKVGDSIYQAVTDAGYEVAFVNDSPEEFVVQVQGESGSYSIFTDTGVYRFSEAADTLSYMWITTNYEQSYSTAKETLLETMANYKAGSEGLREYSEAKTAYESALEGLDRVSDAKATTLATALQDAMDHYESYMAGEKVMLSLDLSKNGKKISAGEITLKNEFGNSTTQKNVSQVEVVSGIYEFDVSDGGYTHVRGTIDATATTTLNVIFPTENWIQTVNVGLKKDFSDSEAVLATDQVQSAMERTYYIEDCAGTAIYPNIIPTDVVRAMLESDSSGDEEEQSDKISCAVYVKGDATLSANRKTWDSHATKIANGVVKDSLTDQQIVLEARMNYKDFLGSKSITPLAYQQAFEVYENYTMNVVRVPTLSSFSIWGDGSKLSLDFHPSVKEYQISTTSDTVSLQMGTTVDGSKVSVNGKQVDLSKEISVSLSSLTKTGTTEDGGITYSLPVKVTGANGQENSYVISLVKYGACQVTLSVDKNLHLDVKNAAGSDIGNITKNISGNTIDYIFQLVPGETYTYITTSKEYYHASNTFKAKSGEKVVCVSPEETDYVKGLVLRTSKNLESTNRVLTPAFSSAVHKYDTDIVSTGSAAYLKVDALDDTYTITAKYNNMDTGVEKQVTIPAVSTSGTSLAYLLNQSGNSAQCQIIVQKKQTEGQAKYYQDYLLTVKRRMQLYDLNVAVNEQKMPMIHGEDAETTGFSSGVLDYYVSVGQKVKELEVDFVPLSETIAIKNKNVYPFHITVKNGDFEKEIEYDGDHQPNKRDKVEIPLDTEATEESVEILVDFEDENVISQTYTIHLNKLPSVETTIDVTPTDALVYLVDESISGRVYPEEDGTYILNNGGEYSINVTKTGYVSYQENFTAGEEKSNLVISLKEANDLSKEDISIEGDWTGFRGNDDNNAVINNSTPIKAEETVLTWANKIGIGYDSSAVGCPIIVGGYLYTYAGKKVYKVSKETGEVVASADMVDNSNFAINTPTYGDGKIFICLAKGKVQAFDAKTLKSLWVYTDKLGGQSNCPITYKDGYIYTGFWNSETKEANYVCLTTTDEDPTQAKEAKAATWTYTDKGFYWSGAYVTDEFALVPTDDGQSGYSSESAAASLLSIDPLTGRKIDELRMPYAGDIRCSICYDKDSDAYYFTSKGGDFYKVKVNSDGTFKENSLKRIRLKNGGNGSTGSAMSSSTPVIYNGRAYVGVSGTSQFTTYSGHNITVIDLDSFSIAYSVPTMGYPQTSGLLTTAYKDEESGREYVYVYFVDNYTPGKVRVIRDYKGLNEVDHTYTTMESYQLKGETKTVETAYVLFTPSSAQAQYAICSLISDEEGNIYFKNDSGYLMCLSNTISSLEVKKQPKKLSYYSGEIFNPEGIQVVAHYANGADKDITKYIDYTTDPLTTEDTEITISYDMNKLLSGETGYWKMYQDDKEQVATDYYLPTTSVTIAVKNCVHQWEELIEPATTEADGYQCQKCSVCGSVKDKAVISMIGKMKLSATEFAYDGKVKTPSVKVKDALGETLTEGVDYTLKYSSGRKEIKTYKCKVTFTGKYSGIQYLEFMIVPKGIAFSKLTPGAKKVALKWKKLTAAQKKNVTGFRIRYSTKKDMTGAKSKAVKKNTATSLTVTGLKAKTYYYVQIQTYKKVNGVNYFSAWSTVKKVKTK